MSQDAHPGKRLLQNTDLMKRYGRTQRTVDRWKREKILPLPDVIINNIPYWYEETIETNERERLRGGRASATAV